MNIACILGPGFEDSEFQKPYEELKKAGHQIVVIGTEAGTELIGDKGKVRFTTEKSISQVRPDQFDALLIPGGHSPDKLRADERFVAFTKAFMTANKPVMAICHGPQLLLAADEYKGHTLTAWKTIQADLQKAGGTVVDKAVCVDGNLVTSRQPDDIPQFIEKSLEVLARQVGRTDRVA